MKSIEHTVPSRAVRGVIPFERTQARRAEELAFLPAALEIVETPPSPIGRAIAATIMLLFCAALAWAWWGTIDIVASATGKIVPSGRTKVIQPFETGVVRSIEVQDGQVVKAGDVLIELDPTMNAAERDHQRSDLLAEQLNVARLHAALAGGDDPLGRFPAAPRCGSDAGQHPTGAPAQPGERTRGQDRGIDRQQAQKEAERATIGSHDREARGADSGHPAARRHAQDADGQGSGLEADLSTRRCSSWSSSRRNSSFRRAVVQEAEAAVAAIRETRRQAEAEYRHTLSDELAKTEQKASGLAQELIKAEQKTRLQRLTAPVDGMVQQLAIHTVGGVVTPAQALLVAGAERQPARNRGDGLEPRHRLRPCPDRPWRSRSIPSTSPVTASCTARC